MDAIAPAVDGKFMSAFVRGQKPRSSWCTPARERNSARSKIPYLRWLLRAIYWIDLVVFLGFGVYVFSQWQWNVRYLVGIGIAVASFALWMVARVQLGKSFSVRAQARALVTTGLYSKFRHPIYLFGELAFAGLFLAWGELIGTCLLGSDLSNANRSIKKRGGRPGKSVWGRIPAIQSEHLVLTVQRMAETLFHEVGEYSGHRGLSGGSTSRGFVYLLSRECRSQWKRTARAAIACFSISPAQIPPACRL